jgi:WhiB family redox-sensing transcriptional regulator
VITVDQPAWMGDALCAQTDPDGFFPEKGGNGRPAQKVCMSCGVREECLEYALANDQRWGVWGGLSEHERRKVRKQRAKDAGPLVRVCEYVGCDVELPAGAVSWRRFCSHTCTQRAAKAQQKRPA